MKYCKIYISLLLLGACHLLTGDNEHSEDLEYFLYEDKDGNLKVERLLNSRPELLSSSGSDVKYFFFSKSNPGDEEGVEIHSNNTEKLKTTSFTTKRETIFIVHGWKDSHKADVNSHVREYILRDHDVNIFVVDWSPIAGKGYLTAQGSMQKVGGYIADFARSLNKKYGLQLNKLKFVGHSLGAHICGCAGAALDGQVDRIVGLDPAGPLFREERTDNRIDASDAENVQIIHTNGGKMGYLAPCGDSDFYPNGGKSQPGCGFDLGGGCAHSRSYAIYAESLTSTGFVGQQCNSYEEYQKGKCTGPKASMGMFHIDKMASGSYYLKTHSKSPFHKG
ncbi:pancreatic triacylglycerol lipase [Diabrotica virgifera virgifera]|uniref:Pancreatic triacylglycerol lipase-like n=1 Tax=Diabrotica virgifera virgifera TaxID=50390 RepID=A0A6P7F8J8_DIAVI|nr:pancreatic triacylglycerol lipase [Diabrotica virgifera virgifera]